MLAPAFFFALAVSLLSCASYAFCRLLSITRHPRVRFWPLTLSKQRVPSIPLPFFLASADKPSPGLHFHSTRSCLFYFVGYITFLSAISLSRLVFRLPLSIFPHYLLSPPPRALSPSRLLSRMRDLWRVKDCSLQSLEVHKLAYSLHRRSFPEAIRF